MYVLPFTCLWIEHCAIRFCVLCKQGGSSPLANLGRNTFNSPYFNIWNIGILKNSHITERFAVQLRVQAFDVFNHRNFTLGNLSIFQVTANALNQGYTNLQATRSGTSFLNPSIFNGGSRVVEFGLTFTY